MSRPSLVDASDSQLVMLSQGRIEVDQENRTSTVSLTSSASDHAEQARGSHIFDNHWR